MNPHRWPFPTQRPHRYTIMRTKYREEAPAYEVRRNAQGTSDDWDPGTTMGVFPSLQEAEDFAHALRTLTLKACPRCGAGLSCNSYEQYCANAECHWNNDQP